MNYFGKHVLTGSGTGKIKIKPVLMRKGNTKLALYGLGYIRDARLHQMFSLKGNVEWARHEDKPGFSSKSWFNTMLIHQNRVHHSPKNAISERYLPSWLDLVVWGHEHECLVEPTEYGDFMVSQLGSSVVTSLIEGEAKQKQVMILEVKADLDVPDGAPMWRTIPVPLETCRPFKYKQIALIDFAKLSKDDGGLGPDFVPETGVNAGLGAKGKKAGPAKHEQWVTTVLERMVHELIAEARAPYERRGEEVPLPLIRLRVDYSGGFSTINGQRFGQKFVGKVANPNDLLQFFKSAVRRRKEDAAENGDAWSQRENANRPGANKLARKRSDKGTPMGSLVQRSRSSFSNARSSSTRFRGSSQHWLRSFKESNLTMLTSNAMEMKGLEITLEENYGAGDEVRAATRL